MRRGKGKSGDVVSRTGERGCLTDTGMELRGRDGGGEGVTAKELNTVGKGSSS